MSGIINSVGARSGIIGELISSNDYIELLSGQDADGGAVGTSWINVVWNASTLNGLCTHSGGTLTFTDKGAGTYYIIASLNAYELAEERWVGVQMFNNGTAIGNMLAGVVTAEAGGTYTNPVLARIATFSSGHTFLVQTASVDGGTAVLYGNTHCVLIKTG